MGRLMASVLVVNWCYVCLMVMSASGMEVQAAQLPAVSVRQFEDRVEIVNGDLRFPASLQCPLFIFNIGSVGGSQLPVQASGNLEASQEVVATYAPLPLGETATLDVKAHLAWNAQEGVLRKWVEYRLHAAPAGCVLQEIQLDQLAPIADQPISILQQAPQSFPGFFKGFFAGVEFPVSSSRLEGNELLLAHKPGLLLQGDTDWRQSRKAVYGSASAGHEHEAFCIYIARHRPEPKGMHFNYCNWWTSPMPYTEKDILAIMQDFNDKLYKPFGVSFDSFCIDMGWSNRQSIWGIDHKLFPQGFDNIQASAERMNSHLGLWISPTSTYIDALDGEWAKEHGYETWIKGSWLRQCCLGGPKYGEEFKKVMVSMATDSGVRHFKIDGYSLQCPETDHGHQPDELSAEAMAEGGIRAFEAAHAAAPDAWLEAAGCFSANSSPWWLFYVNSITGSYGDDSPCGRVPSPNLRESYTTARDFYSMQGAALLTTPIVAQGVLGVLHQTDEPFLNDAVTVILRGHAFIPFYVNPKYMNDQRWGQLAALMKWARANESILAETAPLLPPSWRDGAVPHFTGEGRMPREPYGYSHWKNERGLILLRNPWIKKQTVRLNLAEDAKAPAGLPKLSAVSLYPEVRLYGKGLTSQSVLEVTLAPYETLLLSLAAGQDLAGLKPAAKVVGRELKTKNIQARLSRVSFDAYEQSAAGLDWTAPLGARNEAAALSVEGRVITRKTPSELLIILEGKTQSPIVAQAKLEVNGREVALSASHSGAIWKSSLLPLPEYWTILKAPLAAGKNAIRLNLLSDAELTAASCWAWASRNPSEVSVQYLNALPAPEQLYLDSVALLDSQTITPNTPVQECTRPIERINGVYLDTIKPASLTQDRPLQFNLNVIQKPMYIKSRYFARGVGAYANGQIVYDIAGQGYKRFQTWVGLDDDAYKVRGLICFTIKVDGVIRWESGLMTGFDAARLVDIDVTGAKTLELLVGDGGNGNEWDCADFGDAKLLRDDQ